MNHTIPRIFLLFISSLLLAACARGLNTQFSCQQKANGLKGCASLTAVDNRIDAGLWPPQEKSTLMASYPASLQQKIVLPTDNNDTDSKIIQRQPETINTIWIAPFEDTQGDYHHAQWLDVIVSPSTWQPQPVRKDNALD